MAGGCCSWESARIFFVGWQHARNLHAFLAACHDCTRFPLTFCLNGVARRLRIDSQTPTLHFFSAMTSTAAPLAMTARPALQPALTLRNFLFILPQAATEEEHALIEAIATTVSGMGFVYVASADQPTMEDRGAIRYLPFRAGHFPSFGKVDAVFVLRDREVASAALAEYPCAEAFVVDHQAGISAAKAA